MSGDGNNDGDRAGWALAYARAGFAVLPVWWRAEDASEGWRCACEKGVECDRPAKHPVPRQGVKQATTDPERVRHWWTEHPEANVAIATGAASGVIVIDVDDDDEKGKSGSVSLTTACADRGGVPRTLKARSGSGGRHYWYRFRANPFTRKIGFLKHVDYLADGGYVIVQPSVNLRGGYAWDEDAGVTSPEGVGRLREQMAALPEWFDALEGAGRSGRKRRDRAERATDDARARLVNVAGMEFSATSQLWIAEVRKALTHCDPDARDNWVLFGIILGREFERSDDGWALYEEWAARSAKFEDAGTLKAMRGYFYKDSLELPQNGRPATIATILSKAVESGYTPPEHGLDGRPTVAYRMGRGVDAVVEILRRMSLERESGSDGELRVYAFGSGLGGIIETHDISARYVNGAPPHGWLKRVSVHTPMSIGSRVTHTVTMMRVSPTGSLTQIECPREVSTLLLTDYSKHFPRLNGIVQWPMVLDGRVAGVDDAEYDEGTGLVFALPEGVDLSGLSGTESEARAAWTWLREVALEGFPLSDRSAAGALAMLLTFVQRRAIGAAPAFLITAPKVGTGKTSLVRFASQLIHGRSIGASTFSGDNEEQRKAITAALMAGPPALLFDNLRAGSSFNSEELAAAITSADWEDRKLGVTERVVLPNRAVWCFTGNNVTLRSDLRRRFVTIRLVSKLAEHYRQVFRRSDLDGWAVEHRAEALQALTSILLWGAQLDPSLKTGSGFPVWDREVRGVVRELTGVDPFLDLSEQSAEDDEDEEEGAVVAVMIGWAALCGEERRTVAEWKTRIDAAKKSSDSDKRHAAESIESAVATLRGVAVSKLEPHDWGQVLRLLKDRITVIEGLNCSFRVDGMRQKVAVWKLDGADRLWELFGKSF